MVPPEQIKPIRHGNGKIERMNTRRHGVEQKATKGTKKEIPGLCLLHFLL
jgi:hypothetical protein